MYGLLILGVVGLMYVTMDQVKTTLLDPMVTRYGVNASNAQLFNTAWQIVLVFVAFAFIMGLFDTARKKPTDYGWDM
jgi:uncharacterized membrane protein